VLVNTFPKKNYRYYQSLHQPTDALNKTQFMTSIELLHVSAPECHPQEVFYNKITEVQHVNLGTAWPSSE